MKKRHKEKYSPRELVWFADDRGEIRSDYIAMVCINDAGVHYYLDYTNKKMYDEAQLYPSFVEARVGLLGARQARILSCKEHIETFQREIKQHEFRVAELKERIKGFEEEIEKLEKEEKDECTQS